MTHGQPRAGFYKVAGMAEQSTVDELDKLPVQNRSRAVTIALWEWARSKRGEGSEPRRAEG